MARFETKTRENEHNASRLAPQVQQEILRAISRIGYGSVEVVVHGGQVVQIECREKIRIANHESDRSASMRQIL